MSDEIFLGMTAGGVDEWMSTDSQDKDKFTIRSHQDVQDYLDVNAALRSDGTRGWNAQRTRQKIASIPPIVAQIWCATWGVNVFAKANRKLLNRLLDDPDNRFLRTDR